MPWQRGTSARWSDHARGDAILTADAAPDAAASGDRPSAPAAHSAWGPEFWPAEVRDNVKVWPPVFRERQLLASIRTPLLGPHRLAFVSNKDGVGKSTAARILQTIFSMSRVDACAVIDANVDSPRGHYIHPDDDLAAGNAQRVAGSGPLFAPADGDGDYAGLIRLVTEAYPIVLCDVGTGIGEAATRQILDNCDQIIVVATPAVDGLYAASSCLDDLSDAGYPHLVDSAICAINRIRPMPFSDLLNIDRHFSRRCREVVRIPWDSRVTTDNAGQLDELRSTTRTAFYELAAAVARTFGDPTITMPREEEQEENR